MRFWVFVLILLLGHVSWPSLLRAETARSGDQFTADQTLRELAHGRGVRGGELAVALGLERSVAKDRTLAELGLEPAAVAAAVARLQDGRSGGERRPSPAGGVTADTALSIRQLAHGNDVNGMALTHALGLSLTVDKDTPVTELDVSEAGLRDALLHLKAESAASWSFLKYWLWPPLLLFALWWLVRGGRHGTQPGRRYPRAVYLAVLVGVVVLFGFGLGKSPNPMEGIVKVFKAEAGIYADFGGKLAWLGYFSLLAVVGNKLICGWGCPFGALEELLYSLPGLRRFKRRQLPFFWTNLLRSGLFAMFLLVLFGWLGSRPGMVVYHYLNPFNLFGFELALWTVAASVTGFLLLSLVVYRPFCQLVCPFGWWSWLLEKISIFGIRIDRDRCTNCRACARACPLQAAKGRLEGRVLPADCFSCARCLRVCPFEAIGYGRRGEKR